MSRKRKTPPQDEASLGVIHVVTPGKKPEEDNKKKKEPAPKRQLFPSSDAVPVTPARPTTTTALTRESPPKAKKRLIFGRLVDELIIQDNVRAVYRIVKKLTGSIGGNASSGPIYGELTMGSMQKMINLMKEYTEFGPDSRFIDVGSGIGKPNLHVAQDPGVEFSYGVEVEVDRWLLGLNCLNGVLEEAFQQQPASGLGADQAIHDRCIFEHADVREAKSFDPFTHVYMFSIGFPPTLWVDLAQMWNKSESGYLICYHSPKDIIKSYGFEVELLTQTSTSMHGSKEGHMGYIYRRIGHRFGARSSACDPFFGRAWDRVKAGSSSLRLQVKSELEESMMSGPSTRTRRSRNNIPDE